MGNQDVIDAAMRLYAARGHAMAQRETKVQRFEHGISQLREWLIHYLHGAVERELLAVCHWTLSLEEFAHAHEFDLAARARGVRMLSIFDHGQVAVNGAEGALSVLASSRDVAYHLGEVPVQVKVLDRARVLLEAPRAEGQSRGLMFATGPHVVEAALRYIGAVRATARSAREVGVAAETLSPRQHQVAAMLAEGCADSAVADALDVSIRTVRSEVAKISRELGVSTRFAAGAAYVQMSGNLLTN